MGKLIHIVEYENRDITHDLFAQEFNSWIYDTNSYAEICVAFPPQKVPIYWKVLLRIFLIENGLLQDEVESVKFIEFKLCTSGKNKTHAVALLGYNENTIFAWMQSLAAFL